MYYSRLIVMYVIMMRLIIMIDLKLRFGYYPHEYTSGGGSWEYLLVQLYKFRLFLYKQFSEPFCSLDIRTSESVAVQYIILHLADKICNFALLSKSNYSFQERRNLKRPIRKICCFYIWYRISPTRPLWIFLSLSFFKSTEDTIFSSLPNQRIPMPCILT